MAYPSKIAGDRQLGYHDASFTEADPHVFALADGEVDIIATIGIGNDVDIGGDEAGNSLLLGFGSGGVRFAGGTGPNDGIHETQATGIGLREGGVAVAWTSTPDATSDSDIRSTVTGLNSLTQSILVNAGDTAGNQVRPEVVEVNNGNLAYAWIDLATNQIKVAVFLKGGFGFITNETISTTPASNAFGSQDLGMTALANGYFVVSWLDNANHDHFRIVSPFSAGFLTGQIDLPGTGSTDVAALPDGRFVATYWRSGVGLGGHYAEIFDGLGNLVVPEFQLSTSAGLQSVTALPDDRFMVVYDTFGDIYGRIWNPGGTP